MYGETRDVVECFSLLLECSNRFLSALQQNRAQPRLLYLFYDKEFFYFPPHSPSFSKPTSFSERTDLASACICTLIKHAKISQSQSLLECFKRFDWLNNTKAVRHVKTRHQSLQTLLSSNVTPVASVLLQFSLLKIRMEK